MTGHKHSASVSQNHKAQLANAYNELGKELSSNKIKVVGNYTLGRVIGEGTYGTVRLGTHRLTSTRVAIKQIPKAMSAALTREIHHHRRLHHPHVCKLYEVIATESTIWLVTELCSGGELFDYLAEKGRLSEDESRTIFGQLCLAVGYIHEKGVVHRDLKLENVLLDERCRVKLGDFGFTREFERGALLDTYCGTTGYAAPEMLMAKKYLGPEVDIWSLGIILYCLLTGTLPFDDDDESVMREKIILGEFDIPEWLSTDARDLIRNILQHEPSKRLTIPQILAHTWFTRPVPVSSSAYTSVPLENASSTATNPHPHAGQHLPSPSTSEASFHSASEGPSPGPGETSLSPSGKGSGRGLEKDKDKDDVSFDSVASESTVRQKGRAGTKKDEEKAKEKDVAEPSSRRKKSKNKGRSKNESRDKASGNEPIPERLGTRSQSPSASREPSPSHLHEGQGRSLPPTSFPIRTPARTKRRSVSSILSQPSSPTEGSHPHSTTSQDAQSSHHGHGHPLPQDFAALLRTPAPLLFSTPLERSLLNSLSSLGFDIGQMVHSVLSDACDASGAIWWILKRKAEKKALEAAFKAANENTTNSSKTKDKESQGGLGAETEVETEVETATPGGRSSVPESPVPLELSIRRSLDQSRSAPELSFIPPTPTAPDSAKRRDKDREKERDHESREKDRERERATSPPATPPRSKSPGSFLSPTPTSMDSMRSVHSVHSSPSGKERDGKEGREGGSGSKGRSSGKPRSGSIVQRATMSALEAAGLMRKKSAEAVREREREKEREKEREREKGREQREKDEKERDEKDKERDRNSSSTTDSHSRNGGHGHGNGHSNRLTKSPPMRPVRDKDIHIHIPAQSQAQASAQTQTQGRSLTPEHGRAVPSNLSGSSPWVPITRSSTFTTAPTPTPANPSGNAHDFGSGTVASPPTGGGGIMRNRNSLLTTFRMWFNEDRKGKRKTAVPPPLSVASSSHVGPGGGTGIPPSPRGQTRAGGLGAGTFRRRAGGWNQKPRTNRANANRAKRASISSRTSRRSSSVNSRRSSVASMQMVMMEPHHAGGADISRQRSDPSRRSFTPNSELERDLHQGQTQSQSSRPSSIRSYSMHNGRHRKSTSGGSTGGGAAGGAGGHSASPLKQYHRRAGSGSSTRVVRQTRPSQFSKTSSSSTTGGADRLAHVRSNSTASSIHSLPSSRPGSFYDASEGEGVGQALRTSSPYRSTPGGADDTASISTAGGGRRSNSGYNTVLLAQKKHSAFGAPNYASSFMTSIPRSSWKKAWGVEPPGWSSRPTQFPVEVLAISASPDQPMTIRDVFSNKDHNHQANGGAGTANNSGAGERQSINLNLGDESDWVDEDEDFPAFAGGLGQLAIGGHSSSASASTSSYTPYSSANRSYYQPRQHASYVESPITYTSVSAPRTPRNSNRRAGRGQLGVASGGRGPRGAIAGHSPISGSMPLSGSDGVFDAPGNLKDHRDREALAAINPINEPRMSRRQLPNGRSAPAFRSAIVEEDEEEEE